MILEAPQYGVSEAARIVALAQRKSQRHLASSSTFSKQAAYDELFDVWQDCRRGDWDGGGAEPVERDTFRCAYRFVEALPLGIEMPSAGVEADGHLTLEWYRNPRWTLSVSVNPDGMLYYAALLGSDHPRGAAAFAGEIPQTILDFIRRVTAR